MILRFVLYPTGGGLDKGNGEDVIKGFVDFDHQNADFRPEMSEQGEVIFVPGAEFRGTWVRKGINGASVSTPNFGTMDLYLVRGTCAENY